MYLYILSCAGATWRTKVFRPVSIFSVVIAELLLTRAAAQPEAGKFNFDTFLDFIGTETSLTKTKQIAKQNKISIFWLPLTERPCYYFHTILSLWLNCNRFWTPVCRSARCNVMHYCLWRPSNANLLCCRFLTEPNKSLQTHLQGVSCTFCPPFSLPTTEQFSLNASILL